MALDEHIAMRGYLAQLDSDMAVVSGLNSVLTGTAPASALASSKAITSLIASYENRLASRASVMAQLGVDDPAQELLDIMEPPEAIAPGTEADRATAARILGYDPMVPQGYDDVQTDAVLRADQLQLRAQLMSAMQQLGTQDPKPAYAIVHPSVASAAGL